jgi:hypothetical protein
MAIAASSEGGAMARVDPAQPDVLVATTKARLVNMRGRDMPGWLRIGSAYLHTDDQLAPWVAIGGLSTAGRVILDASVKMTARSSNSGEHSWRSGHPADGQAA